MMELPRNEPENKIMIAIGRDRFSMAWRNKGNSQDAMLDAVKARIKKYRGA